MVVVVISCMIQYLCLLVPSYALCGIRSPGILESIMGTTVECTEGSPENWKFSESLCIMLKVQTFSMNLSYFYPFMYLCDPFESALYWN